MMNDNNEPLFNGSFHYIKLLGDMIAVANGFLVNGDFDSYRNSLCAWYNEVIYRVEKRKDIKKEDITKLKEYYALVMQGAGDRKELEIFHRCLNAVTHKANLRMTDADKFTRGWMKEG